MSADLTPVAFYGAEPGDAPIVAWMVGALPSGATRRIGFTARTAALLAVEVTAVVSRVIQQGAGS